ncbi:cupin domain-containing protein [Alteromonas sp. BL110]|uniref:cupin domain-containing protein n=1 Tax=Alteromonas sp. BL110 TaxID=1714845 RepID=UPI000E4DD33C|nr:cupin domain-containing protein [Alteromonas sp. BL110]AXT39268.1 cupin domain-containing protein [Alteromonas sp. BL110]RKM82248.1 cupin domain-containing protein [Alteromonas sp. BL110]
MKTVKLSDIKPYNPPAHFDMVALKIQGKEETGLTKFWQGLSYFLPNGGANMQYQSGTFGAEFEKSYYVIDGELSIIDEKNKVTVLKQGDSVAILPNEGRKLRNDTNRVTTVLVTFSTS